MTSSPLTAHFQLLPADIQAARQLLTGESGGKSTPNSQRILRTFIVLFLLMLVAGVVFKSQLPPGVPQHSSYQRSSPDETRFVVPLVVLTLGMCGLYLVAYLAGKNVNSKLPILQHPSTVTLTNEEFRVEFGPTVVTHRWDGVPRVANTTQHLILFTQPKDGYIVPRRAFDSDEEFARFADFARAQCEAAKPQTPPIAEV